MKNGLEIDTSGNKYYYLNDQLHRDDGPAIEYGDDIKYWYQYNQLHRLDGPAIEYADVTQAWFYQGKNIDCNSQEEFEKLLKLKVFW